MENYLVVWEGLDGVIQSEVETDRSPLFIDKLDWIKLAMESEEYDPEDRVELLAGGYELYLVVPMPTTFYA